MYHGSRITDEFELGNWESRGYTDKADVAGPKAIRRRRLRKGIRILIIPVFY